MGCEAKPQQFPQLINTQSAAEVLISGKASHAPLVRALPDQTQEFNRKPTPALQSCTSETKQHSCWSVWWWQPHWATKTLLSWEQALKIIIIKIHYVGSWEDQIGSKDLVWNGSVLRCLNSSGWIPAAENVTSSLFFAPRTHSQKLGGEHERERYFHLHCSKSGEIWINFLSQIIWKRMEVLVKLH